MALRRLDAVEPATAAPLDGEPAPDLAAAAGTRRRRRRGIAFWLAVAWLGLVVFSALFATLLPLPDPNEPDVSARLQPPLSDHLLGADGLGRDQLSRVMHAARISLVVSLSAVGIGMLVGGTLGTAVGFLRGRAETAVMAGIDVILAFPGLILLLVVIAFAGRSLTVISLVIGFLSIPIYTRVADRKSVV